MESGPARLAGRAGPLSARMMTTTARRNSHRIGGRCGFRYMPPEPTVCSCASPGLRRQANGPRLADFCRAPSRQLPLIGRQ